MLKKLIPFLMVFGVLAVCTQSCGRKPFACIAVEGNQDSIHVNQPVTLNAYCSSGGDEFYWEINSDSVYFVPRFTITFPNAGEQDIYLLVTSGRSTAGASTKLTIYP